MLDFIERLEIRAENEYYKKIRPNGKFECDCGRLFDPEEEGGVISPNPYAMPVCGECFEEIYKQAMEKKLNKE